MNESTLSAAPSVGAPESGLGSFPSRAFTHSRFRLAIVAAIMVCMALIGLFLEKEMTDREVNETASTVAEYLETILGPELQEIVPGSALSPQLIERLNTLVRRTMLGKTFAALKIRDQGGRILYSSADPSMIGLVFPDDPKLVRAWHDEIAAGISKLDEAENAGERPLAPRLLEVYVPIHRIGSDRILTVAEFFLRSDHLQNEIAVVRNWSWALVAVSMLAVYLLVARLFPSRADAKIETQAKELKTQERLLTGAQARNAELERRVSSAAATVVTLNERMLRTGAEVHDGPLQDLSLGMMRIDNVLARAEKCHVITGRNGPVCNSELMLIRDSLGLGLNQLRAISAGLGVPGLAERTLPSTLTRAARDHERRTGTTVALDLEGIPEQISPPAKITLYRLIQEALDNAFRHARGIGQEVHARRQGDDVVIEVSDRGPGFDVAAVEEMMKGLGDHLGLLGMRERVESLGGSLSIESKPGQGTRIAARLSVDAGKTSHG